MKNVSCISRAGWSAGKFIEENTCQSSSISGPSAIENPKREKIETISFLTSDNGWREPSFMGEAVRERSRPSATVSTDSTASRSALILSVARFLSSLRACPIAFFWSAGTFLKSLKRSETSPFLLKYLMRNASTSAALLAVRLSISAFRLFIFYNIAMISYFYFAQIYKKNRL